MGSILESALERMTLVLKSMENAPSALQDPQMQRARAKMVEMRNTLRQAMERFSVHLAKPDPRQVFAAELSTLWVVLENARPERMKGYGKELEPADRRSWEELIHKLLADLDELRDFVREGPNGH